jgi:hypothetical protein
MTRIVTTAYRPKRPPKKRKAVAIAGPVVVRRVAKADQFPSPGKRSAPELLLSSSPPANDDRKPATLPTAGKRGAIVTMTNRKRGKLARAPFQNGKIAEPEDPGAAAAMRAWLERAKWGRGP